MSSALEPQKTTNKTIGKKRKCSNDYGAEHDDGLPGHQSNKVSSDEKVFRDPIHGSITLNKLLVSIIDTIQFQRLRYIKQLGASYWVYPGACHNRFEHSIGTSHLCGRMIRQLKEKHPDLVTDKDVLCIEIAGLCHDLGHGPFSHVFDSQYKKLVAPDRQWSHEQGSVDMFDHMYEENEHIQEVFKEFGISEIERQLIKDLILGKDPKNKNKICQKCTYGTKEMEKWFLYEIVSNKRNGIDCDKFDYLMRDSYYVGAKNNFDCTRYFQTIRIIPVDGQLQICVRDKEYLNLYEMFHMRWSLHHRVYQHRTTKIVEAMLCEALKHVDKTFNIFGSTKDMHSYTYLTDSIINEVCRSNSQDDGIENAKKLINCIHNRKLYKFCGQVNAEKINDDSVTNAENTNDDSVTNAENTNDDSVTNAENKNDDSETNAENKNDDSVTSSAESLEKEELRIAEEIADKTSGLNSGDLIVHIINISFGMKDYDPVNSVIFFNKGGEPKKIRREHVSSLLPTKFHEKYIRVYCKESSKIDLVKKSFQVWCKKKHFALPVFS